jgi:hypothetical protein
VSSALLQPQHGLPALQLLLAGPPGVVAVLRRGARHSSVAVPVLVHIDGSTIREPFAKNILGF